MGHPVAVPTILPLPDTWQVLYPVPRHLRTLILVAAEPNFYLSYDLSLTVSLLAMLSLWQDDAPAAAEKAAAAAAAATPHVGEYQCESCSSDNTSFDIIGGAAVGTRKAETFGKKDAPELILRVVCHACGNNWLEER